jgi:hypothetical protein
MTAKGNSGKYREIAWGNIAGGGLVSSETVKDAEGFIDT